MTEEVTFEGRTLKELKAFLATGVNAKGKPIRVWTLNWRGRKTIRDLFIEHCEDDIRLVRRADGRIVRRAWNVKAQIDTPFRKLCEVRRRWKVLWWLWLWYWLLGRSDILEKKEVFAVSETRKRSETAEAAALRGVWEELGIHIPPEMLEPITPPPALARVYARESRVYADLLSENCTHHFIWRTTEEYWQSTERLRKIGTEGIIIPDHNVHIYLEWFEKTTPTDGFSKSLLEAYADSNVTDQDIFAFLKGDKKTFLSQDPTGSCFFILMPGPRASRRPQASLRPCS